MGENSSIPFEQFKLSADSEIPFDLFVSKKYKGLGVRGFVRFADSTGNSVYTVQKSSYKSAARDQDCVKQLLDSSGNILFSIARVDKGSWRGYKGNGEDKEVIFTVEKRVDVSRRAEFGVLLVNNSNEDSKTELLMKGNPFKRSCTIYKGDSIVAQTSLMYKLGMGKVFVPRNRFRVTIFPGFADRSLVACLIAVYFDGRKLWI
ncbi:protein LURP-one-related 7 [Salvia miltiorrhiza]|uniref:protein LURP-one-related 7 n=1 Tax=Salvia miltiorrhiza TaxID=226208 RepID=UPI0025ABE590|nr:protein LURP-one-related 7 [Salvia miltiorrhiza]